MERRAVVHGVREEHAGTIARFHEVNHVQVPASRIVSDCRWWPIATAAAVITRFDLKELIPGGAVVERSLQPEGCAAIGANAPPEPEEMRAVAYGANRAETV
jgi:hypothetical protein